jgi:hypothetical protein
MTESKSTVINAPVEASQKATRQQQGRVIRLTADDQELYQTQDKCFLSISPQRCSLRLYSSGLLLIGNQPKVAATSGGGEDDENKIPVNTLASSLVGETLHGDFDVFCWCDPESAQAGEAAGLSGLTTVKIDKSDGKVTLVTPKPVKATPEELLGRLISASVGPKTLSDYRLYLETQARIHDSGIQAFMRFWWHDLGKDHRYPVVLPHGVSDTKLILVKDMGKTSEVSMWVSDTPTS